MIRCGIKNKNSSQIRKSNDTELQISNEFNFEIINEWVDGKRIISIGESTHGIGEFYSVKSEIVQYLHQKLGYEVLAMEGGFADINLALLDLDNLSSIDLSNKTLHQRLRK